PAPVGPADPSRVTQLRKRVRGRTKRPPSAPVSYHWSRHAPSTSSPMPHFPRTLRRGGEPALLRPLEHEHVLDRIALGRLALHVDGVDLAILRHCALERRDRLAGLLVGAHHGPRV